MRIRAIALASMVLLLVGTSARAQQECSPARLVEGEDSIESHLRVPDDLAPGLYKVLCEGIVLTTGRSRNVACYSPDALPPALAGHVAAASEHARFSPAMRKGNAVDVYMVWMARIYITANDSLILVVPNNGVDAARYGLLYTAPQRINRFSLLSNTVHFHDTLPRRILAWQKIRVDAGGRVVSYDVEKAPKVGGAPVEAIGRDIERMEFIPGSYEGRPVPMLYVEPVFD